MTTAPGILEYAYKVVGDAGVTLGGYRIATFLGYSEVTTTGATSFPIYVLPQTKPEQDAAAVPLVLTTAALGDFCITHAAFRLPSGLVATNGDKLALTHTAVTNAGAITGVAASTTYAAGVYSTAADFINNGSFSNNILGKFTSDVTPKLWSLTPGTPNTTGNTVSVASGTKRIPVVISVAFNKGVTAFPYEADINSYLKAQTES